MGRYYEVVFTMDEADNGALSWLVTAPAFPEVITFGDTQEDACRSGLMAIEEAIAARIADGEAVPLPLKDTPGKGRFVELSALTFLKTALYMICREKDISRAELARRLNWHREQVDRLFRLDHRSRLDQMEAAFKEIGVPLAFDIPLAAA
jgi:Uncharacterized conserved protein